ncbi:hypothetical protein [Streptomyces virginiae]|uniref:hypothetical protein n=1 Tax=Streptomyces virginiae TaxID=1961 RepID=UPI0036FF2477
MEENRPASRGSSGGRGRCSTGFARVDGVLALPPLVQRSEQTDRQLADHEARLDALERSRWPLPSLAALVAVIGLTLTRWQVSTAH